jgi:hypothetical protein
MENLDSIIESSNGKIVSVTFIKADGTLRVMTCRLGVTKHLKGGESTLDGSKYLTVFDMAKKGYRAINRDTIQSVRLSGEEFMA